MKTVNRVVGGVLLCGILTVGCNEALDIDIQRTLRTDKTNGGTGGTGASGSGGAGSGSSGSGSEACAPGTTKACYSGPEGTKDVGVCHGGVSVCKPDGSGFGTCLNEITPQSADCMQSSDLDCDGHADNIVAVPEIVSPLPGTSVESGKITLEWKGGVAPYFVDIAWDEKFTDGLQTFGPITGTKFETDVINGGYVYWRVRSTGACGASENANGGELHVPGKPIELRSDPVASFYQPAIAWNPIQKEYGVIFGRWHSGVTDLEFLRVNRFGKKIEGSERIFTMASILGTNPRPDIVHVPSENQNLWAVTINVQLPDRAQVFVFDANAQVNGIMPKELDSDAPTNAHSVTYHPGVDRIVTATEHWSGNLIREPYVEQFNASLGKIGNSIDAGKGTVLTEYGAHATIISLPGLFDDRNSVFLAFDFQAPILVDTQHHAFFQRIDLANNGGQLAWYPNDPGGTANYAGKRLTHNVPPNVAFLNAVAWNPKDKNVGFAFALKSDGSGAADINNAYFAIVDPKDGATIRSSFQLNNGAPGKALPEMPEIAWDGEEFLVAWNDMRDASGLKQVYLSKFDGTGKLMGKGEQLLPPGNTMYDNAIPGWSGKSMVGHDRIHVIVGQQQKDSAAPSSVWMCIEPPYAATP